MRRKLETCADCSDFPCEKFNKWFDEDSFVTHQKCLVNIQNIKKLGIEKFLKEQNERKTILEIMLEKYNPGQCMSLYCLAATLMTTEALKKAIKEIENIKEEDRATSFKKLIQELAKRENNNLKLRKSSNWIGS
jgi:hypothetical protein